jgi:hypothetical protein
MQPIFGEAKVSIFIRKNKKEAKSLRNPKNIRTFAAQSENLNILHIILNSK